MALIDATTSGKSRCVYSITSFEDKARSLKMQGRRNLTHGPLPEWDLQFCYTGDIRSTNNLIKLGLNLDVVDDDGWSPIFMAVYTSHKDSIARLLSAGANPNVIDRSRWTPIKIATEIGDPSIISLLMASERTIVDEGTIRMLFYMDIDANLFGKMLGRFLMTRKPGECILWDHSSEWPDAIFYDNDYKRAVSIFSLLVIAFPNLRFELVNPTKKTCRDYVKEFFRENHTPRRYSQTILNILDRHRGLPTLSRIALLHCR